MKIKAMIAAMAAAAWLTAVPAAAWASTQAGTVTGLSYLNGRVFFTLSGGRSAAPACDCCGRWEIFVSDAGGQSLLSLILTAYREGKNVSITGSNTCVATGNDTEGVSQAQIS